jgi:hypothetical protein
MGFILARLPACSVTWLWVSAGAEQRFILYRSRTAAARGLLAADGVCRDAAPKTSFWRPSGERSWWVTVCQNQASRLRAKNAARQTRRHLGVPLGSWHFSSLFTQVSKGQKSFHASFTRLELPRPLEPFKRRELFVWHARPKRLWSKS